MNSRHVVLDTDFGHGEQFFAAWAEWKAAQQSHALHYIAIAPILPEVHQLIGSPDLRTQLLACWPLAVPGFHRILLDQGRVTLDLMTGTPAAVLPQIDARVDAFHLPATTTANLLPADARSLARLAMRGATLLARAPDETLAWALSAAGFSCKAIPGTPDLSAIYVSQKPQLSLQSPSQPQPQSQPTRHAIVIGAGLAGTAACQRLCARGWDVTLIERHPHPAQEASGNLAGIFMPLLSRDDNIPTRLSRAAYLFALREWQRLGGVGQAFDGAACGVLQLARDAAHAQVQQDVAAAWNYPPDYVRWLDPAAAGARMGLGGATPHGGWLFEQGGWAHPASLCLAMLADCGGRLQRIFSAQALRLQRSGEQWQVQDPEGAVLAQAPTVILANGTGARALAQSAELPLSALRGQVTHLDAGAGCVPKLPLVVCREAYITPPSRGIVCAGATYDADSDPELRSASQQENLNRLAEIVPGASLDQLNALPLAGRVGFRCAAPDRLPLVGALPDYAAAGRLERLRDVPRHPGLYGLLGYASRGLIWAPLMAELLVSQLEQAPPPLEANLVAALDPGRFLLKQRRRSQ